MNATKQQQHKPWIEMQTNTICVCFCLFFLHLRDLHEYLCFHTFCYKSTYLIVCYKGFEYAKQK